MYPREIDSHDKVLLSHMAHVPTYSLQEAH